jgi:hypothetical protein
LQTDFASSREKGNALLLQKIAADRQTIRSLSNKPNDCFRVYHHTTPAVH